jgi:hypothetical protein
MSIVKASSKPHLVVYTLKHGVERTTMRSSYKSWFIGTLFHGEHFFRIHADHTHEHGYVWGYSHNGYGPYGGYGWVEASDLKDPLPATRRLDESVMRKLNHPISKRGPHFYHKYARPPYPPHGSNQARGKVEIKRGVEIPFYGNYHFHKSGVAGRQHPQHPFLTHNDDVRFRYVVRTNPHLIVVDYYRHHFHGHDEPKSGDGIWGVIMRHAHNGVHNFNFDAA